MYFWISGAIVLFLDRLTKYFVVEKMYLGQSVPVIGDLLHLTYIKNPGAAFGMFSEKTWLFVIITLIIMIIMVYINNTMGKGNQFFSLILGVIAGGAVGNLIDRLQTGYVIDFIDFQGIWPYVFNTADMAIVIGTFLLGWKILISKNI
ncbi:MAG: signal peptidase II [Clostridia bacterium]|nr:signal peptidase II [Clostridia bacterium]MDD4048452.1 signal peptidase II [Clostridia bacterium]